MLAELMRTAFHIHIAMEATQGATDQLAALEVAALLMALLVQTDGRHTTVKVRPNVLAPMVATVQTQSLRQKQPKLFQAEAATEVVAEEERHSAMRIRTAPVRFPTASTMAAQVVSALQAGKAAMASSSSTTTLQHRRYIWL